MTLPSAPPFAAGWSGLIAPIRRDETGWRVFALQKAMNSVRFDALDARATAEPFPRVEVDGVFGPTTDTSLRMCQKYLGLQSDAVAGPRTQAELVTRLAARTRELVAGVPGGLMRGFAEGEGANLLAATNWSVPGGVDCGCVQLRVYGPPYDPIALQGAFDPMNALLMAAESFVTRATGFLFSGAWIKRQPSRRSEFAMRCAVMAHNWPAGAEDIARTGVCSQPNTLATWVPSGVKFPDGTPVKTRWDWCQFYALGGAHGEGSITRYVKTWT